MVGTKLSELLGASTRSILVFVTDSFEEHCQIFQQRPFIFWHVWEWSQRRISRLVELHRLDHKTLEKIIYSCLSDAVDDVRT